MEQPPFLLNAFGSIKLKLFAVSLRNIICVSLFTMKFMGPFWKLRDVRDVLRIGADNRKLI